MTDILILERLTALEAKLDQLAPRVDISERVYITTKEAARICGFKSTTPILTAVRYKELTPSGSGGAFGFLLSDVLRWREKNVPKMHQDE